MLYSTNYVSPLGKLTLASDGSSLVGLWIEGQKYFAAAMKEKPEIKDNLPVFQETTDWLDQYFAGKAPSPDTLPLAPAGSEFRRIVWDILCKIPYGQVVTYGQIAKEAAEKMNRQSMSAQAVGGAVGHNPISIVIPCHRVVGAMGNLTGYAGGIDKKIQLLSHEGVDISGFTMPKKGSAR